MDKFFTNKKEKRSTPPSTNLPIVEFQDPMCFYIASSMYHTVYYIYLSTAQRIQQSRPSSSRQIGDGQFIRTNFAELTFTNYGEKQTADTQGVLLSLISEKINYLSYMRVAGKGETGPKRQPMSNNINGELSSLITLINAQRIYKY